MKNKWGNYALKDGKVQSSYVRGYSNKSPKLELREEKIVYKPNAPVPRNVNPDILEDAWVINLRKIDEDVREEKLVEAHQQGQQGIQEPAERRSEAEEGNLEIKTREEEEVNGQENSNSKGKRRARKRSSKSSSKSGGIERREIQEGS